MFRLSAHTTYDRATRKFGCHVSKPTEPLTCAGYLLRGTARNIAVRVYGPDSTTAVSSDRPLYDNYREMAIANGVDPDDPALASCLDSRLDLNSDAAISAVDADATDRSAVVVSRAARIIREFIAAAAGMDLGEPMLDDATLLAARLAAAGCLTVPAHDHHPGGQSALDVIRAFTVECVGDDLGEDTTDLAEQLRRHLAAAGVLAGGIYEPVLLGDAGAEPG